MSVLTFEMDCLKCFEVRDVVQLFLRRHSVGSEVQCSESNECREKGKVKETVFGHVEVLHALNDLYTIHVHEVRVTCTYLPIHNTCT